MPSLKREVIVVALVFMAALFIVASIVWWIAGVDPFDTALTKAIGICGDAVLAGLITLVLWKLRNFRLGWKAFAAIVLSLAAAPISALIDWGMHVYCVYPTPVPIDPQYFAQVVVFTTSELFGWCCLYIALQYNAETRESNHRLAEARHLAISAQLRALQYQVNPHFLFNTLNSIAGLVEEGALTPASEMVLRLSGFLRRTLTLDPGVDMRLENEIALQLEYLHIEEVRFSDRMTVRSLIDPATLNALVPALILQPLIENAIKHGVAPTPGKADLEIGTKANPDGSLLIWVENPVATIDSGGAEGIGIGLRNVSDRLQTRHPGSAFTKIIRVGASRLRVEIHMPLLQ